MRAKFQRKILNSMTLGAGQSFHVFSQIALFLGNNRVLFKFRCRILHYLIGIIKIITNSVCT